MSFSKDAILNTNFGQLTPLLVGPRSIFEQKGWSVTNLHVLDETTVLNPVRDNTQWGETARFTQIKRASLHMGFVAKITIGASVLEGAGIADRRAAYVNNLGDQICRQITHRYGSTILHQYDGEYAQLYRRLCANEISDESRNALTLGGLPLTVGAGIPEYQRRAALTDGFVLYVPLDRLWFAQNPDEAWMPEAYATEGEIEITLARLQEVVYNARVRAGLGSTISTPFTTAPTITSIELIAREVTLTQPEKTQRLLNYESEKGVLTHFLDVESQRSVQLTGTGTANVRDFYVALDNIRLDMQELWFIVRRGNGAGVPINQASLDTDWGGDKLQAPVYDFTALATGGAPARIGSVFDNVTPVFIDVLVDDVTSYWLEVNRKRLTEPQNDLLSRAWVRQLYHPNSQVRDPIYLISFSFAPEETKLVTGLQSAANIGKLELVIRMPDFPANQPRVVDVWAHCHNVIQSKRGAVVKTLR